MSENETQSTESADPSTQRPALAGSSSIGSGSGSAATFFADATLDLEEAHDIADTPEATRPQFNLHHVKANRLHLSVPPLDGQRRVGDLNSSGLDSLQELSERELDNSVIEEIASNPNNDENATNQREKNNFRRISANLEQAVPTTIPRPPRWPRDISWTISFWLLVPTCLFYNAFFQVKNTLLAQHPLSFATLHAITWTIFAVIAVCRLLYKSLPGGDGDDVRLSAANLLATAAPVSVLVYAALTLTVWLACPTTRWAAALPAFYTIRDVHSFRRWNRRTMHAGAGYASRIAFFQAVTSMALDILSRSLRRASFYRVLSALLLLQLCLLLLWRQALLGALASGSSFLLLIATWAAGKWATGTVTRTLTLLSSAGVMHWCTHQANLLAEMPDQSQNSNRENGNGNDNGHNNPTASNDDDNDDEESYDASIPEAYRTVDASVYQSVLVMDDEMLDDDYDDLEEEAVMDTTPRRSSVVGDGDGARSSVVGGGRRDATGAAGLFHTQHQPRATVKTILWTAVTKNFGSLAHCGLLGGVAQFVWSQIRKVEFAQNVLSRANGFRGMRIGDNMDRHTNTGLGLTNKLLVLARGFVRNHSDLAMTHVAAYYKGYGRAARDVATIIEESGLEPILHEDITTHMCTSIAGSMTGIIVLITTYLLLHQRKSHPEVSDFHVVEAMLISFILSYTLIFTALEPLRAAIKASYVAFAQNPRCLSQAFPLIYYRLCRMSESNLS